MGLQKVRLGIRWRLAIAGLLGFTAVALGLQYLSTPERVETPKVGLILEDLARGNDAHKKAASNRSAKKDDPTAGKQRNITITAVRGRRSPLGTLRIPAIGVKARFYDGVFAAAVELGPGHWPGTPLPGQPGNSVFAGHRTTYTAPFEDLDLLGRGDKVITRINTKLTRYSVFQKKVVPEAGYQRFVLAQPEKKRARVITLFACTPKGQRSHRIVVRARAVPALGPADEGKRGGATDET